MAYAELYVALWKIIPNVDFELHNTSTDHVRLVRDCFFGVPQEDHMDVHVRVTSA
jgi:hypothetical protein